MNCGGVQNSPRSDLEMLRSRLREDLKPVRPLCSERLCFQMSSAFLVMSFLALWAIFGFRPDSDVIGGLWLWVPSLFQIAVALGILGLAMGESLPGRSPSSALLWLAAGSGLACHFGSAWVLSARSPMIAPESQALRLGLRDFGMELCLGLPMLLVAMWIARRGFTARTARVGLAVGAGTALAADGVWRLFCPISDPAHVLSSHTLAIVTVVLAGVLLALLSDRRLLQRHRTPTT